VRCVRLRARSLWIWCDDDASTLIALKYFCSHNNSIKATTTTASTRTKLVAHCALQFVCLLWALVPSCFFFQFAQFNFKLKTFWKWFTHTHTHTNFDFDSFAAPFNTTSNRLWLRAAAAAAFILSVHLCVYSYICMRVCISFGHLTIVVSHLRCESSATYTFQISAQAQFILLAFAVVVVPHLHRSLLRSASTFCSLSSSCCFCCFCCCCCCCWCWCCVLVVTLRVLCVLSFPRPASIDSVANFWRRGALRSH